MKRKTVILALGMTMCLLVTACGTSAAVDKKTDDTSKTEQNDNKESSDADQDETDSSNQDKEENKEEASQENDGETEAPEIDDKTEETISNIGDNVVLKDWEISVTDVQIIESISADYISFSPKESGNKYAQVFVTVNNKGKQSDTFLPSYAMGDDVHAKILYGDGYEFTSTVLLGYNNDLHNSGINPLSSKTGEIIFEIPETVASAEDELVIQFVSGNDTVKFKLR